MHPILAFVIGAATLEIVKFGTWLTVKPGWKPGEYTRLQAGHLIVLLGGGSLFCVAWSMGGLDVIAKWLPDWLTAQQGCGATADSGCTSAPGIPYTPQVGLWYGVAFAFQGVTKIITAFKERSKMGDGGDAKEAP